MAYFKVTLLLILSFVLATYAVVIITSDESIDRETFLSTLQYNCRRKTGNDETFNRIQNYTETFQNCMNDKFVQVEEFANLESISRNLTSSNRIKFFSTYCAVMPVLEYCSDLVVSEMRKCFNQEMIEFVDATSSAGKGAFNLTCQDHGAMFFDNDGNNLKCVGNPIELFTSCLKPKSILEPVAKLCNNMVEWRTCLQSKLSQCNDEPRLMELLDIYFRPIAEGGFCRKYTSMDENTMSINGAK